MIGRRRQVKVPYSDEKCDFSGPRRHIKALYPLQGCVKLEVWSGPMIGPDVLSPQGPRELTAEGTVPVLAAGFPERGRPETRGTAAAWRRSALCRRSGAQAIENFS